MAAITRSYNAKVDAKQRITLRNTRFKRFTVKEYQDGSILLEPEEPVSPFHVSADTLAMMDSAMEEMQRGVVSPPIDLSDQNFKIV